MDEAWRQRLKPWACRLGALRALPALAAYRLMRRWVGDEQAFSAAFERVSRVPGLLGVYARQAFCRWTLSWCGRDVVVGYNTLLSKPAARLGNGVYIGRHCVIGWATIEDEAMLADGVQVLSGRHQHGDAAEPGMTLRDNPHQFTRVVIGRGAWIGAGAIVMADVGAGAIVGAGAVVVDPVEPGTRVAGVPAEPIGRSRSKASAKAPKRRTTGDATETCATTSRRRTTARKLETDGAAVSKAKKTRRRAA